MRCESLFILSLQTLRSHCEQRYSKTHQCNDLESLKTSVRDVRPRWSEFPFISSVHSRRSRQRQKDILRIIAAGPYRGRGLTAARIPVQNSIKYKMRILAYRSSYSSILESILVYSRYICRDRSREEGGEGIRNAIHTYFRRNPLIRVKEQEVTWQCDTHGRQRRIASFLLYRNFTNGGSYYFICSLSGKY